MTSPSATPVLSDGDTLTLSILVVDDDPLVRAVVQAILAKMGCTVESRGSGGEACLLLADKTFDLVMTDFMMPEMNGEELIMAMRNNGIETPVVVITGGRTDRIVKLAQDAGAFECIEKPINRRKMRAVLEQVAHPVSFSDKGTGPEPVSSSVRG